MAEPKQAIPSFSSDATMMAELVPAPVPAAVPTPAPTPDPASRPSSPLSGPGGPLFAGRYELLRELGRGGMGVVYHARDTMVGDVVALKTLEISGGASDSAVERFRREVRLARRITHPNVARTHDLGEFNGHHYLTMELIDGSDLQGILARERRLGPMRAAAIAWMVCEGLAAAHAAGVVHRDLKPANILVERSGRVILTDFGIARAFAGDNAARTQGSVGTLVYMAPEQVTGESSDPRTDLYAVGLLLYEMLTGELAFTGETPLAAAIARLSAAPPDPRTRIADVPACLAELVLELLARAPEGRPPTAEAVSLRLGQWLESIGETPEKCSAIMATLNASATSASASALMRAV
ncbi:MAG: serine/threonine-protein kinase, partial [Nannocystaceae bacterium]